MAILPNLNILDVCRLDHSYESEIGNVREMAVSANASRCKVMSSFSPEVIALTKRCT